MHLNIVYTLEIYRQALFGMYIKADALQNFISVHAASTLVIQTRDSLEKVNSMVYFDQIMDHSAGNDQFAFFPHIPSDTRY